MTTSRRSTRSAVSSAKVARPMRGSSSSSSATASVTVIRIWWMWSSVDPRHRLGLDGAQERVAQLVRRGGGEQVGQEAEELVVDTGGAGVRASGLVGDRGHGDRGVLERLALDEPGQQQVPLLPEGQLVVEVDVAVAGEQPLGLQLDQGGGDEEELGGQVQVHLLEPVEVHQVGVDDVGEPDLVEVDLVLEDQVQEQVEGTLEHRSLDVDGHARQGRRGVRGGGGCSAAVDRP